ncbi:RHS repeat-associated core domain-containing protein [Pseudomonas umsongensis]|jgi:RHS repeat-associated protein|uniref:RHS repeat-associated core domain-containing protein n=1 Tax=Pseudomonas umsongensis TaxID=198618 RepID=UPI0015BFE754|nr:RHS repeat-associated core domain-containing protein [Pseudomonas umsongensis]NWL20820.1 Rhs family protein [Pseudomonas umsongensis]
MREIMLCRYTYDPLDRLVGTLPLSHTESQRFYCKSRLVTEIEGALTHSIFQHDDVPLGQQQSSNGIQVATLLATDQQRSILHSLGPNLFRPIVYSPYGHQSNGLLSLLGFNGEREDPVTGHYLLGNGYRAFNPVLMRFISPDSWSPFGDGGLNPYAYCQGNPVHRRDPSGHVSPIKSYMQFTEQFSRRIENTPTRIKELHETIQQTVSSFDNSQKLLIQKARNISTRENPPIELYQWQTPKKTIEDFKDYSKIFNFVDGVPQTGEMHQLPNGSESYLFTRHFDVSINFYADMVRTSPDRRTKMIHTDKLSQSIINRAQYVIDHSKKIARVNVRAPRGQSPVRWSGE